ncbi:Isoprenylcysteine carboxyl methyltransferase [Rhodoferax ferrireducens T118]|uniref:Isoprenylcysteine carboxyl methyltransferase n=1 Tax=Albidiferax ferrireducens (strain ATCC BAA-621 / DSM 15236 / T118) TaxID=338969 RepID=Q220L7_ALBFT|nr:isoprenylcysteine carboxylmethyltransferase family protein [Rhodoferax ferrireducens]ABD68536.1 Isoprenylcysteine carboxyl methyltransferase [Rhodoferax ferrireducens T118]
MNTPSNEPVRANIVPPLVEGRLTEWLLRTFALLVMAFIVTRWGYAWWINPSRWTALLLLVSEGYTLMLVLLARRATHRDLSVMAMVATIYAVCYVVLLAPQGTAHLAPEWVGAALLLASMAWQFTAKIVLGRSFGLLPAQRGLVMVGPYRIVRHPIYFGYLIGHIGFLLANFSWRNAAVLALLYVAQVVRIQREEAMLASSDANYRRYQQRVRWRLLPLVY